MLPEGRKEKPMIDHTGVAVSDFHPNSYGAFVRDPDGHNIEAVCHEAA
jgi:hypothetical protein